MKENLRTVGKKVAANKWKSLVVVVLVVAWIVHGCGQPVLSTNAACTSIRAVLASLHLPIGMPVSATETN